MASVIANFLRNWIGAAAPTIRPAVPSSNAAYIASSARTELRQAELLTNLYYYVTTTNREDATKRDTLAVSVGFSFLLTPDCDLLQDYKARKRGEPSRLDNALLFEAESEDAAKARSGFGTKEWKKVKTNEIERFYFLDPLAAEFDAMGTGIAHALVIDFRRYYTLPPIEIERQCEHQRAEDVASRRCYLSDLWREHLQRRAMSYMQRVALPDDAD